MRGHTNQQRLPREQSLSRPALWRILSVPLLLLLPLVLAESAPTTGAMVRADNATQPDPQPEETTTIAATFDRPTKAMVPRRIGYRAFKAEMRLLRTPWLNACGVVAVGSYTATISNRRRSVAARTTAKTSGQRRQGIIRQLLRNITVNSVLSSVASRATPAISIDNIVEFSHFQRRYGFLPQLTSSRWTNTTQRSLAKDRRAQQRKISLVQIHKHTQIIVAALAQELLAQMQWDYTKQSTNQSIAIELRELYRLHRNNLCDIEIAVNATRRTPRSKRLRLIKAAEMRQRLVKLKNKASVKRDEAALDSDPIEMKFVKFYSSAFICDIIVKMRSELKSNARAENSTDLREDGPPQEQKILAKKPDQSKNLAAQSITRWCRNINKARRQLARTRRT